MRKKIGKRIGPVPIALVAVLALAAFISAGLWLVPNGQYVEAQDFRSRSGYPWRCRLQCQVDKISVAIDADDRIRLQLAR